MSNPETLRSLRARAGLTTRKMSAFALLSDPSSWARAERTGVLDPARLLLVRARVAQLAGDDAEALRLLRAGA